MTPFGFEVTCGASLSSTVTTALHVAVLNALSWTRYVIVVEPIGSCTADRQVSVNQGAKTKQAERTFCCGEVIATPFRKIVTVSSGRIVDKSYCGSTGTELSIGVDIFGNSVTVA